MRTVPAVAALVVLVTACGTGAPPAPSATSDGTPDFGGTWQLERGTDGGTRLTIPEEHPITLVVEPSSVSGTSACNHYSAELELTGSGVRIGEVGGTAMACVPEDVMAAEAAYLAALPKVTDLALEQRSLVLSGPRVELRFARLPDPPTAALVDTEWILDTLFVGDVASSVVGERATLELRGDGSLAGGTGCRSFTGRWVEEAGQIVATQLAMDDRACAEALAQQDSHVVSVIGDGFVATVEGDHLTLTDPGRVGLVYRLGE